MKMLSDIINTLFQSLQIDDEPVNILVDGKLHDILEFYYDENINEYVLELTTGYEYERNMGDRFSYYPVSSEIVDGLTGYTYYCPNKKIVDLLNKLNSKSDANAKKYFDLKIKKQK